MIEDDIYRSSTQYRLWSFTPQRLAEIRRETNELASEKVKAAFRRVHGARNGKAGGDDGEDRNEDAEGEVQIETLTVDEELKIVEWGCGKIIEMGEAMRPKVPGGVVVCLLLFPVSSGCCLYSIVDSLQSTRHRIRYSLLPTDSSDCRQRQSNTSAASTSPTPP